MNLIDIPYSGHFEVAVASNANPLHPEGPRL